MGRWRRLGAWLDERTGLGGALREALEHPVPGGARWVYVCGSVLVFLLLVQAVTGFLLATVYAPTAAGAWASVAYVEQQVRLGWLVRGVHAGGAGALIVVSALHLVQVTWFGAYRRPREVTFWIGLVLQLCLFGFALTGYLLPWDQKGYWATQVATSLLGSTPVVGGWLRRLVLGGPEYGTVTLTHFYALHTLLLPAVTALLVVVHVGLVRRHGVTPSWRVTDEELRAKSEPFWPGQLGRDLLAMAVVFGGVAGWAVWRHGHGGPTLGAPADPSSAFEARPEWYFLPLYQLLKLVPGALETVVALGAPLLAGLALAALPLVDASGPRDPSRRKRALAVVLALLGGQVALGALAIAEDRRDPRVRAAEERADVEARRALALAAGGVPAGGVWENDPLRVGRRVFAERCAGCHVLGGRGEREAPDLDGWSSRAWLRDFLRAPDDPRFYGATKVRGMKPVRVDGADLDALVEWVYAAGEERDAPTAVDAAKVARGKALFGELGCDDCHDVTAPGATPSGDGDGPPDLGGRATRGWLRDFLREPGAARFFGRKNEMPKVGLKLTPEEFDAIVALLRDERARPSARP